VDAAAGGFSRGHGESGLGRVSQRVHNLQSRRLQMVPRKVTLLGNVGYMPLSAQTSAYQGNSLRPLKARFELLFPAKASTVLCAAFYSTKEGELIALASQHAPRSSQPGTVRLSIWHSSSFTIVQISCPAIPRHAANFSPSQ
jgi:hypothetical protein